MKAVVEGLYGVQNLGDDFLLCSIVQTLLKADKDIKIHVFSSAGGYAEIKDAFPEANIKFINGETRKEILFRVKRKILRYTALFHCDIYIFGGGGLFPVDKPYYYKDRYQKLLKAKKLGARKLAIYGIDICGVNDEESKKTWNNIAKITDYLSFRNRYSAEMINRCLDNAKATYGPDISFSYISEYEKDKENLEYLLLKLGLEKGKYIIWALAMPWNDEELKEQATKERYNRLLHQISNLCNRYSTKHYTNVFLPFFHNSDCKLISDVQKTLKGQNLVLDENQIPLLAKRALFKDARACVSMRFHGIAFSLYYGLPVAAISYAPKSSRIMIENGLGDYYTEFGIRSVSCFFREFDIDEERLTEVCDKAILYNDREMFQKVSSKMKSEAMINEKELLNLLKKKPYRIKRSEDENG